MENPLAIANYFIKKSLDTGEPITPMKLVKLVYLAHGWYLGLTGEPLISEGTQAWKYGPVIPSVYEEFKSYGGNPVTELAWLVSDSGQTYKYPLTEPNLTVFLDKIWEVYRQFSATDLSDLTHQENSPWFDVWHKKGGSEKFGAIIPNDSIQLHYKQLAEQNLKKGNSNAVT